tara:strand:+ start:833 stop:1090 length:258 start_codon:yes stop_codon:yes gene_type:complete
METKKTSKEAKELYELAMLPPPIPRKRHMKMKELDLIAQGIADHIKEIIEDSADWQLADVPLDGDDYQDMKEYVINLALNKLLQK